MTAIPQCHVDGCRCEAAFFPVVKPQFGNDLPSPEVIIDMPLCDAHRDKRIVAALLSPKVKAIILAVGIHFFDQKGNPTEAGIAWRDVSELIAHREAKRQKNALELAEAEVDIADSFTAEPQAHDDDGAMILPAHVKRRLN